MDAFNCLVGYAQSASYSNHYYYIWPWRHCHLRVKISLTPTPPSRRNMNDLHDFSRHVFAFSLQYTETVEFTDLDLQSGNGSQKLVLENLLLADTDIFQYWMLARIIGFERFFVMREVRTSWHPDRWPSERSGVQCSPRIASILDRSYNVFPREWSRIRCRWPDDQSSARWAARPHRQHNNFQMTFKDTFFLELSTRLAY